MSSSLPEEVQIALYRTVPGLENCEFMRTAYAIEYDCIDATQLKLSLEFKNIAGLFGAGQFNGTSGYEEAAAQGLIAGINAVKYIKGEETSTNPVATIFAWSGALRKRGEMDNLPDLIDFANRLEKATIKTIEEGEMTGDLIALFKKEGVSPKKLSSKEFLKAIAKRI